MVSGIFELNGLEEYLKGIEQAGEDAEQAAETAVVIGGDVLLEGMQRRVPVDSGDLKSFLDRSDPEWEGLFVFVRVGIPRRVDAAKKGFSPEQAEEISRYAAVQEYGSASNKAQPYIRPAFKNDKRKMRRAQRESLERDGVI
jgi:HK97 gp10 family phage protein